MYNLVGGSGRVGSMLQWVGSGRVMKLWPTDNSVLWYFCIKFKGCLLLNNLPKSLTDTWIENLFAPSINSLVVICNFTFYGRPLSVSGRPCYILPMFLFIYFLWPPYSPVLVNGGSRKFYTWWTLSGIREVTTWIFSWSPLKYRVGGQKVTKFSVFSDRTRKLSALTPERGRIL